jgi:hypothetical protein
MLKAALEYLNTLLSATSYFDSVNGLVVIVKKTGTDPLVQYPAVYCGKGEFKQVTNFDCERGVSYWRLTGEISSGLVDGMIGGVQNHTREYPLRLVAAIMRSQFDDNAYSEDKLAVAVAKTFKDREKELRPILSASRVELINTSTIVDPDALVASELFQPDLELRARMLFIAVDFTLRVTYQGECAEDFCDEDVDVDAVIRANVIDEITANPEILTEDQTTQIEDAFCDGGAPANVYNDKATPQLLLGPITGDNTLPAISVHIHSANDEADASVSVPPTADDLHVHLRNSLGEDANVGITSVSYTEAIDHLFINLADMAVNYFLGGFDTLDIPVGNNVVVTVRNSALTVLTPSGFAASGTNVVLVTLADITLTINDQNGNTLYSATQVAAIAITQAVTIYDTAAIIKSFQTVSYQANDDGDLERGRLSAYATLSFNNVFGNTNRFTDELGGQTYANNIKIDHATWVQATGKIMGIYTGLIGNTDTWSQSITNAAAVSVGTFTTGWAAINMPEAMSLVNFSTVSTPFNTSPLSINAQFWTSTTRSDSTTTAYRSTNNSTLFTAIAKTNTQGTLATRSFTWNGSALT